MKKLIFIVGAMILFTGCVKKEIVVIEKKDKISVHQQKQNAKEEWKELDKAK